MPESGFERPETHCPPAELLANLARASCFVPSFGPGGEHPLPVPRYSISRVPARGGEPRQKFPCTVVAIFPCTAVACTAVAFSLLGPRK